MGDSPKWEIVVDDGIQSVRRLAVPTGWVYQTADGWKYNTVAGTVGRQHDPGYPSWGPLVFVPNNKVPNDAQADGQGTTLIHHRPACGFRTCALDGGPMASNTDDDTQDVDKVTCARCQNRLRVRNLFPKESR